MKKRFFLLVTLGFTLIGCREYDDQAFFMSGASSSSGGSSSAFLYGSDGSNSQVALLPVVNHSNDQLCEWDLSKEFAEEIRKRLLFSQKIYPVAFTLDAKRTQDISYSLPVPQLLKAEDLAMVFISR